MTKSSLNNIYEHDMIATTNFLKTSLTAIRYKPNV